MCSELLLAELVQSQMEGGTYNKQKLVQAVVVRSDGELSDRRDRQKSGSSGSEESGVATPSPSHLDWVNTITDNIDVY